MKKSENTLKKTNINNNAKSYLAKLLATENISVEHKKVKTAYFDVKSRLLVLPIWKDMNEDITDLLIAHEVGHALFTPQDGWQNAVVERNIPKSFCNVIEDARIEKLIKRKYPGLSQTFIRGYRDLINNDFFGTKDKDLNDMLLIDRLNIHFKSSHVESPVTFKDAYEKDVVSRMEKLETFEDVIELADELSKYCKEEQEEKDKEEEQQMQMNSFDDHDDGDSDYDDSEDYDNEDSEEEETDDNGAMGTNNDSDKDDEEIDSKEEPVMPSSGQQSDKELHAEPAKPVEPFEEVSAETDQSWEDNKVQLLDPKSKNNEYINIHNYKNVNDYIVDYKTVLKDFDEVYKKPYLSGNEDKFQQRSITKLISRYRQFNKDQSKKVSYMVKEYEMKKAASAYSRTKQDKSGVIDPLKLHSYKYNDDIFKRMAITPDGKNHGMMMFIDWSGSMADKISPTVHQLMNLTMFCQKVNIPFEVYAFSNDSSHSAWDRNAKHITPKDKSWPKYEEGSVTVDERLKLLNFVSSRMNAKEYEKGMINLFLLAEKYDNSMFFSRRKWHNMDDAEYDKYSELRSYLSNLPLPPEGYGLCSTPLNDCIMASMPMVNAFRKKYAIDKMNTIFLTDGCSDGNDRYVMFNPSQDVIDSRYLSKQPGGYYITSTGYDNQLVLRDTKTKKEYYIDRQRDMTDQLLDALRVRTGTKVLGFYISSGKTIDRYTIDKYFPSYTYDKNVKVYDRKKVNQEYRKNKCLVVKHNTAYDEFYLLAGGNLQVSDGQMATPSENAKKSEIKKLFTSTLKQNKDSRVVLNKFISQVA